MVWPGGRASAPGTRRREKSIDSIYDPRHAEERLWIPREQLLLLLRLGARMLGDYDTYDTRYEHCGHDPYGKHRGNQSPPDTALSAHAETGFAASTEITLCSPPAPFAINSRATSAEESDAVESAATPRDSDLPEDLMCTQVLQALRYPE